MALKEINKAKKLGNVFTTIKDREKEDRATLNQEKISEVLARKQQANTDMMDWKDLLDQAHTYATPNGNAWRNAYIKDKMPGQNKGAPIYDLTLSIAHRRLISKMLVGMIPKGQNWLRFVPGDQFIQDTPDYQEVQKIADILGEQFFKLLDRSKFYLCTSEALSDALISTGFMTINEGTKENPFRFTSVSDSLVMVEGDGEGEISGLFRDWININVGRIKNIWPDAKTPAGCRKEELTDVYECSYIDWDADDDEKYCYAIISKSNELLYFARSASWPWVYFRMYVLPGETRGRGPSLDAVPNAATINMALHDELVAAAFQANPMFMAASDSAFNTETFVAKPGLIIPVQLIMGEWPIQAFPSSGNPQFSALVIEDLRQQIRELLYTEPLGPVSGPQITATEASLRYTENLETFSAMIPRLQAEFFDPVIKRCMYIMRKLRPEIFEGMNERILDKIISVDGDIIGLRYETPIMTARGEINLRKFTTYFQTIAQAAGPEAALASLNMDMLPQFISRSVGLDASLIKSMEVIRQEIGAVEDNARLQLEQQQMMEQAQMEQQGMIPQ